MDNVLLIIQKRRDFLMHETKERYKFQMQEVSSIFVGQWFSEGISLWTLIKILVHCNNLFSEEEKKIRADFLKKLHYKDIREECLEEIASLGLYKAKRDYNNQLPIDFVEFANRYMESDIAIYISRVF